MTNKTKRRTRLSPDARKAQLLNNAVEVFAHRGIGRAGHADIAILAEVSVATIFNYFNTREDLVNEVLNEVEKQIISITEQSYAIEGSAFEKMIQHQNALIDAAYDVPDLIHIYLEWSASVREDVWPRYTKLITKINESVQSNIAFGLKQSEIKTTLNEASAAIVVNGALYLAVQHISNPEQPSRETVKATIHSYLQAQFQ
ncbi:TetR/AcrR family transcriptional regulator [Alginatibacterium sediminis]|uniref:TetR/AcrR family transcriptional regulator n=1 Tax=Alginatibacterium sediminis TaxID=2164068 RepID=A0A420E961_9ALTE|nr:TetR/AcrR family transcriptional regulator [Alginatibacterium sediminis]RKF15863.1 TetR/AcrR family transcriptional regulator [Alginatibacterium sediminis]